MKKLFRLVIVLLIFVLCFTGCAKDKGKGNDPGNGGGIIPGTGTNPGIVSGSDINQGDVTTPGTGTNPGSGQINVPVVDLDTLCRDDYKGPGIHEHEVTATESTMLRNGKSDYKIVIPDSYTEYEYEAAYLIRKNLALSTGYLMPVVSSSSVASSDTKIISVGDTEQMRASGIAVSYDKLGDDGFRIVTKGDTVYISGARSPLRAGTYYGAEEFLRYTINWEAYTDTEIRYDSKNVIPLYKFDVTEVPDIAGRKIGYYSVIHSTEWRRYLRLNIKEESELPFSGHSHFNVLPPKDYVHAHPDWYWWESGKDYDTVGDSQFFIYAQLNISNEEMQEEFSRQLAKWFIENPGLNFAHLGIQDSTGYCDCDDCTALMKQYNTNFAGISVIFTNKVARRTQQLVWETDPERNITVEMFAYYSTIEPPVHEENGVLVPDAPEVIPDDNVYVQFTPLGSSTTETLDHENNAEYDEYLRGWKVLTDRISTWFYGFNWISLIINHKNWDTVEANLRYFVENGVQRVYDQGPNNVRVTHMFEMKVWAESKLMWNLSLNFDDLVKEFIRNYYGVSAPYITEMYNLMTTYTEYAHTVLGLRGPFNIRNSNFYSFGYVESVRKIMEKAMAAAEALKETDPAGYEKYYWRVAAAYTENMFMQMQFYQSRYSREYCENTIDLFEATIKKLDVTAMNENNTRTLNQSIDEWRSLYV